MYAFFHTTHVQAAGLYEEAANLATLDMAVAVDRARRAAAAKAKESLESRNPDVAGAKHPWVPLGSYLTDQTDRFRVH